MKRSLSLLMLALFLLGAPLSCSQQVRAQGVAWDSRLNALGVTLQPASSCSPNCWRLISAAYEDEQQSAGLHHIWSQVLNEQGAQLVGQEWRVTYPGNTISLTTKPAPEWADFPMYACYNLNDGGRGAYSAYVGNDPAHSDIVQNMGLPYCVHNSFRLIWRLETPAPCPSCAPRLWLPIVAN